jgi:predicted ATP-dependent endonuclease of OLD family
MIKKILIENFRSIEKIELNTKNICALIGPNSTGKTNILKALAILLGETYPTERAFGKDDFFKRDIDKTICIQVWFENELSPCRLTKKGPGSSAKELCAPVSFRLTHTKKEGTYFNTMFSAFDKNGVEYYCSGDARDQISFVYIPSDRNLERQMTISKWTLLGKILMKIDENFRKKDENKNCSDLEKEFKEAMKKPKEILESSEVIGLSYKDFKKEFIKVCKENTKGLADSFSLDLQIYDPLFYYKTIQIMGKEDLGLFNVEELGSGVQNLVLLSLFKTYAKLMKDKAILAIEEPEIYLHPQAQRKLYGSFLELAYPEGSEESGSQIFYTTHNPNFVDSFRPDEAFILSKNKKTGTYKYERSENITAEKLKKDRFKIYTNFNTERNELFFARKVLLVEGDSDKILFETIFKEKWNIDVNKECISIVECGGKGGVIYFIGVCRLLGLKNFFAVWDEDIGEVYEDKYKNLECALGLKQGWQIPSNLEEFLYSKFPNHTFRNKHKVEDAYKWAKTVQADDIPVEFEKIRDFFQDNREV